MDAFSGRFALSVLNKTHLMVYGQVWPKRQAANAGSFLVEVFFTPPNTRTPFHVHEEVTVVVPLSGLFVENTLKTSIQGEAGVAIVETPESPHENIYSPLGGTNLRLRMSTELERLVSFEPRGQAGHVRTYEIARDMAEHMSDPDPLRLECAGLEILGFVNNGPEWVPRGRSAYLRDVVGDLRANIWPERGITSDCPRRKRFAGSPRALVSQNLWNQPSALYACLTDATCVESSKRSRHFQSALSLRRRPLAIRVT